MALFVRCALLALLLAGSTAHSWAQDEVPPNILLVIADDMGLDASPCHGLGSEKPDMPVLEAMCDNGLVFDNVWAEPTCSPTRATILTGRYGFRTGVLGQLSPRATEGGIRPEETSIQELLDAKAPDRYAHAVVGKWHLSDSSNGGDDNPEVMGVGFYSGLIGGAVRDYYRFALTTEGETREVDGYATTVFTDIAIDWLAEQDQPWFLWLAYNAPHTPFHVPPAGLHDRQLIDDESAIEADPLPYYLAALEALDHEMGRLIASLTPDERENTTIIFVGDNGTPGQVAQSPFTRRTAKGTLYPGGVGVPLIVSGARVTRKGEREDALINTTDLFATIADLAGAGADAAQDGKSFVPLLSGTDDDGRSFVYADYQSHDNPRIRQNNGWSIREGAFQLLMPDNGIRALFDLSSDPGGKTNLLDLGGGSATATADSLEKLGATLRDGGK